ncbi:MAG: TPR repeat-containing protein, partial [Caldanaerobacter subterraneus]
MGWRFRRSISLGKGVRINVSKSGIGFSVGKRGARIG